MLIYRSVTSAGPWPRAPSPQQQNNHLIYVGSCNICETTLFILDTKAQANVVSLFYEQIIVIGRFWFLAKKSESAANNVSYLIQIL